MARYRRKRLGGSNPHLQMLLLLLIISVAGMLSYRQLTHLRKSSMVNVVVAAENLPQGTVLVADNLNLAKIHKDAAPPKRFMRISDVEGRKLNASRHKGEPLLARDVMDLGVKKEVYMSDHVPKDRLLTTIAINEFTIPLSSLRAGDRVDILSAAGVQSSNGGAPHLVVRDAYVVAHIRSKPEAVESDTGSPRQDFIRDITAPKSSKPRKQQALIVAVKPEYVIPLAQLQESKTHLRLIVHSRQSVEEGTLLAYKPSDKVVELIHGATVEKVTFE